jgi:HK97 gp10 family phage protein
MADWSGLDKLSRQMDAKVTRRIAEAIGGEIKRAAQQKAPRGKTGILKRYIEVGEPQTRISELASRHSKEVRVGLLRTTFGFPAFYGLFVEYGTKVKGASESRRKKKGPGMTKARRGHAGTKAQPFLRPAVRQVTPRASEIAAKVLKRELGI